MCIIFSVGKSIHNVVNNSSQVVGTKVFEFHLKFILLSCLFLPSTDERYFNISPRRNGIFPQIVLTNIDRLAFLDG